MANELTYTINASYSKNGRALKLNPGMIQKTITGNGMVSGVATVAHTIHEALSLGDIASPGLALIHNLSTTNYIQLGYESGTFVAVMNIPAGCAVLVSLDGLMAAPFVKANTASCLVSFTIFEQ